MKNLLQVADKFKFTNVSENFHLIGQINTRANLSSIINFDNLCFDTCAESYYCWTEYKDDGWHKHHDNIRIDKSAPKEWIDDVWEVIETKLAGKYSVFGGNSYPDGHCVNAKLHGITTANIVRFYQSGCFNCVITPEMLELVDRKQEDLYEERVIKLIRSILINEITLLTPKELLHYVMIKSGGSVDPKICEKLIEKELAEKASGKTLVWK